MPKKKKKKKTRTRNLNNNYLPLICFLTFFVNFLAFLLLLFSNGNRTEWSPIQSVILRVVTKSDDLAAGVRFVYHEYDYRLKWTTQSPIIN